MNDRHSSQKHLKMQALSWVLNHRILLRKNGITDYCCCICNLIDVKLLYRSCRSTVFYSRLFETDRRYIFQVERYISNILKLLYVHRLPCHFLQSVCRKPGCSCRLSCSQVRVIAETFHIKIYSTSDSFFNLIIKRINIKSCILTLPFVS